MDIDAFIAKWSLGEGGAERANAAMYTVEMLQALGLPAPDPACATTRHNDYVFERAVRPTFAAGPPRRIDLYKRGCFLMEHKQSRMPGQSKALPFGDQLDLPPPKAASTWDTLFRNARAQAFAYAGMLPSDHVSPPFVIICDVARSFEVWADFSGTGRGYAPFPDRRRHRFTHADLIKPEIQTRLKAIWTDPHSLDPARISAAITREIADELAVISRRLEQQGVKPEDAAHFVMRCIFTIFAADVGLLSKVKLITLLEDCARSPTTFVPMFEAMWACFDADEYKRRFFLAFGDQLPHINGGLFSDSHAFPLGSQKSGVSFLRLPRAGRTWNRRSSAAFWNTPWPQTNAAVSAPTTRPAAMWSAWSN